MTVLDPYKNIDWNAVLYIQSMSHDHYDQRGGAEEGVDTLYSKGFRHFNWSEYRREEPFDNPQFPDDNYGSAPTYPLSRWHTSPPQDIVNTPNCEIVRGMRNHHVCIGSKASIIGRNWPDFGEPEDEEELLQSIWSVTLDDNILLSEPEIYKYILDGIDNPDGEGLIGGLLYPDAGGIVVAHRTENTLTIENLDKHGERYLGMAIYNDRRSQSDPTMPGENDKGYYVFSWDEVLATGRRCWGFGEADRGERCANILLTDDFSEYGVLKAYRDGRFYTKMNWADTGLKFNRIEDTGSSLIVECEAVQNGIKIITEKGVVHESSSNSTEFTYPTTPSGEIDLTYVRVEALGAVFTDEQLPDEEWPVPNFRDGVRYEDEIYSQAIHFRSKKDVDLFKRKERTKKYFSAGLI